METSKCEFDLPIEHRSSTGLHPGMFDQDVGFRFEVNVKTTEPDDVKTMLDAFKKATADFLDAWGSIAANK
jgi:hypothetical protein